jgi:hypothetical protein
LSPNSLLRELPHLSIIIVLYETTWRSIHLVCTTRQTENYRFGEKKDTPIIASYDTNEHKELYCRWCNHTLHKLTDSSRLNENWCCSNCSISYDPDTETDNLRSKSKLVTSEGVNQTPHARQSFLSQN